MKKFLVTLFIGAITLLGLSPVHAATSIALTEPTHRLIDGTFLDDDLATELAPSGKLGSLIFPPTYKYQSHRDWFIDPALIADVQAMTDPYKLFDGTAGSGRGVALAWLSRLHSVIADGTVRAIVQGNPSEYWVKRLTPHDRNYLLKNSQELLSAALDVNVAENKAYFSTRYFSLKKSELAAIDQANVAIQKFAMYMSEDRLALYRAALEKVLNTNLTIERRTSLINDLALHIDELNNSVRLVTGKFTITSSHQNLPVTVVNGFEKPVRVNLLISSSNQRIIVNDQKNVFVGAKSKVQVMVPVTVVASGSTGLDITLVNTRGQLLSPEINYPVSVNVISPIATWITTGAALVLFFAAVARSFKRLRRKNFRATHE